MARKPQPKPEPATPQAARREPPAPELVKKSQELAALRATDALLRAEIKRMTEQVATGELVSLEVYNARLFTEARRVRDAALGAPARYAAELAAALDVAPFAMLQVLNAGVRKVLSLAAGNGPFPSDLRGP